MTTRHILDFQPESDLQAQLPTLPGPWMEDVWVIFDGPGTLRRSGMRDCSIAGCTNLNYKASEDKYGLCYGHWWRWDRAGRPALDSWTALPHSPVRPSSTRAPVRAIDLGQLPPAVRTEIRYVVGTKISVGDWTPNTNLYRFLAKLHAVVLSAGAESLTDRRPQDWILLMQQRFASSSYEHTYGPYARMFFVTLSRGLRADPWDCDRWDWQDMFHHVLGGDRDAVRAGINWSGIEQDWLRQAGMRFARLQLTLGERKWGTVVTWARVLTRLSAYLSSSGVLDQQSLTRTVFLGFLADQRSKFGESSKSKAEVNLVASLLSDLNIEGLLPELPTDVYLRPRENRTQSRRQPRPWPQDVLRRIELEVIEDVEVDFQVRLMLKFCRFSGPRISELVHMPIDALVENGKGGFWIEYWMEKVDRWRRFPIPADLGRELAVAVAEVRAVFGDGAKHMFPSRVKSNTTTGVTRPWSAAGFAQTVDRCFRARRIDRSAITGEKVSGSDIHRFRHTIGTELLNNGWTQQEVQAFLGHSSPTMTAAYAEILDDTLNRKADAFHRLVQRDRSVQREPHTDPEVERLREKFSAVLPLGRCTLPSNQHCSVRSNPCLSCAFFSKGDASDEAARTGYRAKVESALNSGQFNADITAKEINSRLVADLIGLEE